MSIDALKGFAGSLPQAATPVPGNVPTPVASSAVSQPAPPVRQAAPDPQQIRQALESIKAAVPAAASALQFSLDDQTGKTIVRVTDSETGELIRQIPSEELLEIAHAVDKFQSLLLKQRA